MLIWSCFSISMNFPNCFSSLVFRILWGKEGDGISWKNMGSLTSGKWIGYFSKLEVVSKVFRLHCAFVTCSLVGSTKGVTLVDSDTSTLEVSGVIRFFCWWIFPCWFWSLTLFSTSYPDNLACFHTLRSRGRYWNFKEAWEFSRSS